MPSHYTKMVRIVFTPSGRARCRCFDGSFPVTSSTQITLPESWLIVILCTTSLQRGPVDREVRNLLAFPSILLHRLSCVPSPCGGHSAALGILAGLAWGDAELLLELLDDVLELDELPPGPSDTPDWTRGLGAGSDG